MQMAGDLLMSVSKDERERAVYRSRQMYQTDLQSNLHTAYDNGEKKGRAEGIQEGHENAMVISINNVMESFGVSLDKAMNALKIPADQQPIYANLIRNA